MPRTILVALALLLAACGQDSGNEALGTLERDRIVLKATADEIVVRQPVPEGTDVSAGTVLVQLDDRQQRAVVARARAEVARAEARLTELRNGARPEEIAAVAARVEGARAELFEARESYKRARTLREQGLVAQATLDGALAKRNTARAALNSAREDLLRLTNGTRSEQLAQGSAAVDAARAQLTLEKHRLSELTIATTVDAYLDSLPWHVGERVTRGAAVAVMLARGGPYARVYVPEPWRARLQVGDRFPVAVDGVDEQFTGTLRWIASDPAFTPYFALNANDRARLVYLAEFDLEGGSELPAGVPAQVLLRDD